MRLIGENGENLGVLALSVAIAQAKEKGLDVVAVNLAANPPVAKLLDYQKFKYHQQKAAVKPKRTKVKSVRFNIRTSGHDLETKVKQIQKFLEEGHKVQVQVTMRGREKAHGEFAKEKLTEFLKTITMPYTIEQEPRRMAFGLLMMIRKK